MFLIAALSLGFLGSFHCIGMCGPIAMAIPVKRDSYWSVVSGAVLYNLGRIVTYGCFGFVFGVLGKGVKLTGWQDVLSIVSGILILLLLFVPRLSFVSVHIGALGKLKTKMRMLFGSHSKTALFTIGIINGLLPCGLVYLGIIGALATGDTVKGTLFMVGFGLGTFPAMLSMTFIRDYIGLHFRNRVKKIVPVFITLMAVLLIVRGLNLGIPYVSPSAEVKAGVKCHTCCRPAR